MSDLIISSRFSSNTKAVNEGSRIPGWGQANSFGEFQNWVNNRRNWYWDGTDGDNVTDFFYNLYNSSIYVQYGQDVNAYASARFFSEIVTLSNEYTDNNNNISFDANIEIGWIGGTKTTHSVAGWPAVSTLTVAGNQVFQYVGNTIDTYWSSEKKTVKVHTWIPPQGDSGELLTLHWNTHFPQGQSKDLSVSFGILLKNPLAPVYRPNSSRRGDSWQSNHDYHLLIQCREGGTWQDFSSENGLYMKKPDHGHNRIRLNGQWLQAPKMTGGKESE